MIMNLSETNPGPSFSVELRKDLDPHEATSLKRTIIYHITRAIFIGKGRFGNIFSSEGYLTQNGSRRFVVMALKIFIDHSQDFSKREADPVQYKRAHLELKRRRLPVFSTLREILVKDTVIGLAMTDLTRDGTIIISANEIHNIQEVYQEGGERWIKFLSLLGSNEKIDDLELMLQKLAEQATKEKVLLAYDSIFICLNDDEMRVMIGDLDNVETNPLGVDRVDFLIKRNMLNMNFLISEIKSKQKSLRLQGIL